MAELGEASNGGAGGGERCRASDGEAEQRPATIIPAGPELVWLRSVSDLLGRAELKVLRHTPGGHDLGPRVQLRRFANVSGGAALRWSTASGQLGDSDGGALAPEALILPRVPSCSSSGQELISSALLCAS